MTSREAVVAAHERGEFFGTDYEGAWNLGFDTTGLKEFQVYRGDTFTAMSYDGTIELLDEDGSNPVYDLTTKKWKDE